jgi:hypothetical protein
MIVCILFFKYVAMAMPTPALFYPTTDVKHRSYLSAVVGTKPEMLRPYWTGELQCMDARCIHMWQFFYFYLICLILTIVENRITRSEDTPWRGRNHIVKVLVGVPSVAVRVGHVLQCTWQCGQQGSATVSRRNCRCLGGGGTGWS